MHKNARQTRQCRGCFCSPKGCDDADPLRCSSVSCNMYCGLLTRGSLASFRKIELFRHTIRHSKGVHVELFIATNEMTPFCPLALGAGQRPVQKYRDLISHARATRSRVCFHPLVSYRFTKPPRNEASRWCCY
jgi:hypothetical protein